MWFPPVIAIVGPTAVGKSRLALELAEELRADIVTADSRQVYRYMDIGTAKPSRAEQACVRHYMIDLVTPDEPYSVKRFGVEARRVLERVRAMGRVAFVVGGTGFYVRALLDDMSLPAVPPNPPLRAELKADAQAHGSGALHARLAAVDRSSASRIHQNNLPRIVRALEIVEYLGAPVPPQPSVPGTPALYLGLHRDRERLYRAADARVRAQVRAGLVEETRLLLEMGYGFDLPALAGLGYREMVAYLRGEIALERAIERYQAATRHYIRRQLTWFRQDRRIVWLDAGPRAPDEARMHVGRWLATASSASPAVPR